MIKDLIKQANKAGFHHGTDWVGMIHDGPEKVAADEKLSKMEQAYKDNLDFILGKCETAQSFEMNLEMDQCIAWLRGEINELEKQ